MIDLAGENAWLRHLDPNDRQQLQYAVRRLQEVLWESFAEDRRRSRIVLSGDDHAIRPSEIKRRFKICEKWFEVFRGDKKFGLIKTFDLLSPALRADLDGEEYVVPEGAYGVPMRSDFLTDEESATMDDGDSK